MCQPWGVAKTPVCVLGLGLIGGSILRAATAAGREAFGYNRSVEGAQAARFDGFDATTDLTKALTKAADLDALIVLAVPIARRPRPTLLSCRLGLHHRYHLPPPTRSCCVAPRGQLHSKRH